MTQQKESITQPNNSEIILTIQNYRFLLAVSKCFLVPNAATIRTFKILTRTCEIPNWGALKRILTRLGEFLKKSLPESDNFKRENLNHHRRHKNIAF